MYAAEVTANVVYQLDKCIFPTCFLRWVQLKEKELIRFWNASRDSPLQLHVI